MANATRKFKVHFKNGDETEIRRFNLENEAARSIILLREKLQILFPTLRNTDYKIYWKDSDGDNVTILTDEDLRTIYDERVDVNVLHVYTKPDEDDDDEVVITGSSFPVVYCDSCNAVITGFRYKCMQCPDFDLCSKCEGLGLHSEHFMLRALCNNPMPRCGRKFMHHFHRSMRRNVKEQCGRPGKHGEKFRRCGENREEPTAGSSRCPFSQGYNFGDLSRYGMPLLEALNPQNPAFSETLKKLHETFAEYIKPGGSNQEPEKSQPESKETQQQQQQQPKSATEDPDVMEVVQEPTSAPNPGNPPSAPPSAPGFQDATLSPKIQRAIHQMREMGFSDSSGIFRDLLIRYDGDVEKVIRAVLEN